LHQFAHGSDHSDLPPSPPGTAGSFGLRRQQAFLKIEIMIPWDWQDFGLELGGTIVQEAKPGVCCAGVCDVSSK
jgi:hypothetical protein